MAALLAIIAMTAIAGSSWWMINRQNDASIHILLEKDVGLQSARISGVLRGINTRMSGLTSNPLITNSLFEITDKERYLVPFLNSIQRVSDVPVDILFTDFQGYEIARNGNKSFSEQEFNWLREKFPSGQDTSRIQLGEKGDELLAVNFIVISKSVEGALLYRIKLGDLPLMGSAQFVHGKESKLLHSPEHEVAAVIDAPPIYKHLNFTILLSHGSLDTEIAWWSLWVFFILGLAVVVVVVILGLYLGKRLTKDLLNLESFARRTTVKGFGVDPSKEVVSSLEISSLEISSLEISSLEVSSLSESINRMLENLEQQHTKLNESEIQFRTQSQRLSEVIWATDIGTWEWNVQTGETVFNNRWAEIVGYTLDELAPISINTWSNLVHPDDAKRSGELLTQCFNRELETYACEARMRHKNGEWVWIFDRGRVVEWTEDGKPFRMVGTHQEITERKQQQDEILFLNTGLEERVQQRTEELASYIQAIGKHALISVADLAGNVIEANDMLYEISGYTSAEVLGQNHRIFSSGTHPKEFFAQMWATITRGDNWYGEICNRAKDGHLYWLDAAIVPIKDSHGRVVRFLSVRIDVTERKLAQDEILSLNSSLEERVVRRTTALTEEVAKNESLVGRLVELDKLKNDLIQNVNHELRTPLTSIIGYMDIIIGNVDSSLEPKLTESLAIVQRNALRLELFVEKMMQVSKIEFEQAALAISTVAIGDLLGDVDKALKLTADNFGVELTLQLDSPASDLLADGDVNQLEQVFANLVNNAIKFTPRGGKVTIVARHAHIDGGYVEVKVIDTGIGIPVKEFPNVFKRLFRASTALNADIPGFGIGLSLVHFIVQQHHGTITFDSTVGKGSVFTVTLPTRYAPPRPDQFIG